LGRGGEYIEKQGLLKHKSKKLALKKGCNDSSWRNEDKKRTLVDARRASPKLWDKNMQRGALITWWGYPKKKTTKKKKQKPAVDTDLTWENALFEKVGDCHPWSSKQSKASLKSRAITERREVG